MRPPGPLVALRLIFAAPVPLRDQLVFALHCTSMRTYAGYSTGCGEGGSSVQVQVFRVHRAKARDTTWERRLSDVRSALRGHWGGVENPVTVNTCGTRSGN